ncbi:MAG: helix-turn-helix domain-containing protein [Mycobacterium sp.]|nr:helix-turn-helix domain-containing protein [Mycobacterium sp.]
MSSYRFRISEASEYLNVPVNTLYYWRSNKVGPPSYTLQRMVYYDRADLDAWVAEQKAASVRGGNIQHSCSN